MFHEERSVIEVENVLRAHKKSSTFCLWSNKLSKYLKKESGLVESCSGVTNLPVVFSAACGTFGADERKIERQRKMKSNQLFRERYSQENETRISLH